MTAVRVRVYGITDGLPPRRPSRLAVALERFRTQAWPLVLAGLGLLAALAGLLILAGGEGWNAAGVPVLLLGAGLTWRGGRRLPGGWREWVH